jgi:hypothetical protein
MSIYKPSVQERYHNDANFRALTDLLAAYIYKADYTPSEVREAAMLACIKIEMESVRYLQVIPRPTEEAIEELRRFVSHEEERTKK